MRHTYEPATCEDLPSRCNFFISAEIWKEYVGYDLDLDLPAVIPSPDHVTKDTDYDTIVDGNQETCATVTQTTLCHDGLKVSVHMCVLYVDQTFWDACCQEVSMYHPLCAGDKARQ